MSVRPCNLFISTNWLSLITLPQTCRSVSIYIYIYFGSLGVMNQNCCMNSWEIHWVDGRKNFQLQKLETGKEETNIQFWQASRAQWSGRTHASVSRKTGLEKIPKDYWLLRDNSRFSEIQWNRKYLYCEIFTSGLSRNSPLKVSLHPTSWISASFWRARLPVDRKDHEIDRCWEQMFAGKVWSLAYEHSHHLKFEVFLKVTYRQCTVNI